MAASYTNVRVRRGCTPGLLLFALAAPATAQDTVVLVARHAERASQAPNSDLSAEGLASADALAEAVAGLDIRAVYTTDFCRTAQTGLPAARAAGIGLHVAGTGSSAAGLADCTPAIDVARESVGALGELADRIRTHTGQAVLVIGHSNTVPALVGELAGRSACPDPVPLDAQDRCMLPESAYGDLYIVRIPPGGEATVEHRRYR